LCDGWLCPAGGGAADAGGVALGGVSTFCTIGSNGETAQKTAFVAVLDTNGGLYSVNALDIKTDSVLQAVQEKRPYRSACMASTVFYLPLDNGAAAYVWETNNTNVQQKKYGHTCGRSV